MGTDSYFTSSGAQFEKVLEHILKIAIDITAISLPLTNSNFTAIKNWHRGITCVPKKVHERRDVTMIVIKRLFDVSCF